MKKCCFMLLSELELFTSIFLMHNMKFLMHNMKFLNELACKI